MRLFDRPLAVAGWLAAAIGRRARRGPLAVVIALVTASLIPVFIVGATPQPADISFENLQARNIPAMTEWFRLEGELRAVPSQDEYLYTLQDPQNDRLSVTVVSEAPLTTGHTQVTGRISGALSVDDSFATIRADVPTEPARHDPWLLFSLPAILAAAVVLGRRVGYPVVRRDGPPRSHAVPLGPSEPLQARWFGWIGNESVPVGAMRSCTITIAADVDVCQLTISEARSFWQVSTRRASPKQRLRICRTDGSRPALEIHAPSADLIVVLDEGADRDRLAAALE